MKRLFTVTSSYYWLCIILLFFGQSVQATEKLVLGVYQYQSKESVTNQYQGLADYLSSALPNHQVELQVYKPSELLTALQNQHVQLLLVNPNLYEVLRNQVSLNGIIATQQSIYEGHAMAQLGGVIFTKQSNPKTYQLSDLVKQRIAIPSKKNAGAYALPLYEMYKANVDYKKLNFIEVGDQDSVIEAVLSGKADVGFLRTGILEKWQNSNRLTLDQIRIINPKKHPNFPHLVSSELYPEWPFVILPGLNETLNRDIVVALFSLNAQHPAAQKAGITGFVTPKDYTNFRDILKTLQIYPYDKVKKITFLELWQQYTFQILAFVILFIFIVALLAITQRRKLLITEQEQRLLKQTQIDQLLLELPQYAEAHSETEVLQYALDQIEQILDSPISFIHSINDDQETIQLLAWSHNTLKNYCHIELYKEHYPISKAGIWAEAARTKKPVVVNDYANHPNKKGLPTGHAVLNRMISMPVVEHNKVVLLAGLGNKKTPYTPNDVNAFALFLNEIWGIIQRIRNKEKLNQQKNKFQRLLNDLGENYLVFSLDKSEGLLTYVSAGFYEVFEQPEENVLNQPWFLVIDWLPESIETGCKSYESFKAGRTSQDSFTLQFYPPKSNKLKTVLIQQHAVYQENSLISIDGLVTDITEQNEAEQKLKQAAIVFESANEGILICDKNNNILRANQRVEQISGYSEAELIGKNPKIFSSGHQDPAFYKTMWNEITVTGSWEGEVLNRRRNGEFYPQMLKITAIFDNQNQPSHFIALLSDITFEKEHQEKLEKMAHYDALTNLPNRFLLSDRITQAIHSIQRNDDMIAIMFIDLDGFKLINDTYGHQAGDFLLKTIAERLLNSVREGDTVARIGGDEFVIVITSTSHAHEFAMIEQRLLAESSKVIKFENNELDVSSSIGSVYYGHQYGKEIGSEQLLRLADQAMYQAKEQGKNTIQHYSWNNIQEKTELIYAFEQGDFELFYQPKVNCKTGEILSLEALIRWNHPEKGLLSPFAFLPQIEQFDLMDRLTEFVLDESLKFIATLNQTKKTKIGISVNIEGNSLLKETFVDDLLARFNHYKSISPQQITFEILESASLEEVEKIASQINHLKTKGFKFSIDDFGTGHASLTYLKNLPVNEVKIDQSFIKELFKEPNSLSIIEAIKSMAEAFNINVIAEGAETDEHIELLLKLGIQAIQGYAIAKPMTEAKMLDWLNNWKINPAWLTVKEATPQNKILITARLAHQAWLNKFIQLIQNNFTNAELNISSHKLCEFGLWLNSSGTQTLSPKDFEAVDNIHQEIHKLAEQVLETNQNGMEQQSQKVLGLLKQKSEALNTLMLGFED